MLVLLGSWFLGRVNADESGIETLQRPLDRTALTCGIRALNEDHYRSLALLEMQLEIEQAELVLFEIPTVNIPGEGYVLIERIQLERLEIHKEGIKERKMELRNSGKERQKVSEHTIHPKKSGKRSHAKFHSNPAVAAVIRYHFPIVSSTIFSVRSSGSTIGSLPLPGG